MISFPRKSRYSKLGTFALVNPCRDLILLKASFSRFRAGKNESETSETITFPDTSRELNAGRKDRSGTFLNRLEDILSSVKNKNFGRSLISFSMLLCKFKVEHFPRSYSFKTDKLVKPFPDRSISPTLESLAIATTVVNDCGVSKCGNNVYELK